MRCITLQHLTIELMAAELLSPTFASNSSTCGVTIRGTRKFCHKPKQGWWQWVLVKVLASFENSIQSTELRIYVCIYYSSWHSNTSDTKYNHVRGNAPFDICSDSFKWKKHACRAGHIGAVWQVFTKLFVKVKGNHVQKQKHLKQKKHVHPLLTSPSLFFTYINWKLSKSRWKQFGYK